MGVLRWWPVALCVLVCISACAGPQPSPSPTAIVVPTERPSPTVAFEENLVEDPDLGVHFSAFGVQGAFVLYDLNGNTYLYYNRARCDERFIPASTFKILNALIALEVGSVVDEDEVIPWDGVDRGYDSWNQDHDLRTAMQHSAVWFYQELARRTGRERIQQYVDAVGYGNRDISGEIDTFWLEGGLRISPNEQIDFLKRLYFDDLPFSERSLEIVKDIIVLEEMDAYRLSGKSGWAQRVELQVGWLVGYVERDGNVYFFATNVESAAPDERFGSSKFEITETILQEMGLLQDS